MDTTSSSAVVPAPLTLLLVEDDDSLRASLEEFLDDQGFAAKSADTVAGAWRQIQLQAPDLCLLDVNLPDGSGLEVLRKILEHGLSTRVIVMTAMPLAHLRPNYRCGNLVGWLAKPVAPDELLASVREATTASRA
ncbi:MAG: response regulator transcription factor [Tepidisphaeraceae bacterium]